MRFLLLLGLLELLRLASARSLLPSRLKTRPKSPIKWSLKSSGSGSPQISKQALHYNEKTAGNALRSFYHKMRCLLCFVT